MQIKYNCHLPELGSIGGSCDVPVGYSAACAGDVGGSDWNSDDDDDLLPAWHFHSLPHLCVYNTVNVHCCSLHQPPPPIDGRPSAIHHLCTHPKTEVRFCDVSIKSCGSSPLHLILATDRTLWSHHRRDDDSFCAATAIDGGDCGAAELMT